ncbi:dpf-6 [Symbiodinium sp. CCMP2592]|nr:dpf-6 [Symbiodinium sp. CCMP2592]
MVFSAYHPRYLACSQLHNGKSEAVNLKTWVYSNTDGERLLLLELRRLLHCCGKVPRSQYVHEIVNKGCGADGEWRNCFELLGLSVDECLVKSKKASKYSNKNFKGMQQPELLRNEWQITTLGALALLCQWSISGMHRNQERCRFLFRSMLEASIPGDSMAAVLSPFSDTGILQRCLQRPGLGTCVHLSQVLGELPTASHAMSTATFLDKTVSCLCKVWSTSDSCESAKYLCLKVLEDIALLVEQHLVEFGHEDVLLGRSLDPAADRRQAVDEDVVEALRQQAVEHNLSRQVLNCVHNAADRTAGLKWQKRDACRYIAKSWEAFQKDRTTNVVVAVSLDAKRLGDPGQDLLVGAASRDGVGVWLPPQDGMSSDGKVHVGLEDKVLTDEPGVAPESEESAKILQSELLRWLETEGAEKDDKGDVLEDELRPYRAANMHYMLCFEHAVKAGTGYSLCDFLPLRRPQRLQPHERRETVIIGRQHGVGQKRMVLADTESGKRSLEHAKHLDSNGEPYLSPSLVVCVDQGSIGWPCVQMAFQSHGLRGLYFHDPWHRVWNDLKAACVSASFWSVVRECTLAMNVRSGPFEGAAFHGQLQSALQDMATKSSFDNVFFANCYPNICREWGLQGALDYGSESHMETVFQMLCRDKELKHKGSNVKWARWASFFDAGQAFRPCWSARLCIMLFHGWRDGWWASLSDAPLGLQEGEDYGLSGLLALSKAAGSGSGATSRSVKHSNDQVNLLRKECKNSLEMATLVMNNEVLGELPTASHAMSTATFLDKTVSCLCKVWSTSDSCESAKYLCLKVLEDIALLVEQHLVEFGHEDVLLGRSLDPAADRRQAVDEDVVEALRQQAVEHNLSRQVLNCVHNAADRTAGLKWQKRDACRYIAKSWEAFQKDRTTNVVVAVSLDAKRLGDPGQDLLVGAASRDGVGVWLPPQVLTDEPGVAPESEESAKILQSELLRWLETEGAEKDDKGDVLEDELRPYRAANMHYMLCFEHAVKAGTGYSLCDFLPLRRPQRLQPHERRETVIIGRQHGVGQKRMVLADTESGKRSLEHAKHLDSNGEPYLSPSLVVCVDQGSIGWPCVQMAFQSHGLRGLYFHDPWHRVWNDLKAACVSASFWSVVRECTLAMNVRSGPFEGAAFHGQLQSALQDMATKSSFDNVFFANCYPNICREWGLQGALDYGSESHMETVFQMLCRDKELKHKGSNVKWARWASFFDAGQAFRPCWSARLCIMLFHGWRDGWWASLSDAPLGLQEGEDYGLSGLLALSKAAGSGSGATSRSVKHSNDQVNLLRKECKNSLEMATLVMNNEVTRRMFNMLLEVVDPVRIRMGKDMKAMQASREGTLHVLKAWNQGSVNATCREVFQKLQDRDSLDWAGMDLSDEAVSTESQAAVENEFAQRMAVLAREVCATRAFAMGEYSHAPPFLLVGLLEAEAQRETLEKLQCLWHCCLRVEEWSLGDPWYRSFLDSLVWPNLTTVRCAFIDLEEVDWQVTQNLRSYLLDLFGNMSGHTKMVEEAFNLATDTTRRTKNGRVEKLSLWQGLADSDLLVSCPGDSADTQVPKKLPEKLFLPDKMEGFSLGGSKGLKQMSSNETWVSLSPANHSMISWATRAMLSLREDLSLLKQCWQSLLPPVGWVLARNLDFQNLTYVLKCTPWGVLSWPMRPGRSTDKDGKVFKYFCLDLSAQATVQFSVITDMSKWYMLDAVVRSPAFLQFRGLHSLKSKGIIFQHTQWRGLLEAAASLGFRGLTLPNLQKLYTKLGIKHEGKRPSTVKDVIKSLLKHCFPGETAESLEAMLAKRESAELTELGSIINSAKHLELAEQYLEPEEVQKCKKKLQGRSRDEDEMPDCTLEELAKRAAPSGAAAESSETAQRSSKRQKRRAEPLAIDWKKIEIESIRKCMPQGKHGAVIVSQELKNASRWRVQYPRTTPGHQSFSLVYHDEPSERRSVIACLRWAWKVHGQEGGEQCYQPYAALPFYSNDYLIYYDHNELRIKPRYDNDFRSIFCACHCKGSSQGESKESTKSIYAFASDIHRFEDGQGFRTTGRSVWFSGTSDYVQGQGQRSQDLGKEVKAIIFEKLFSTIEDLSHSWA